MDKEKYLVLLNLNNSYLYVLNENRAAGPPDAVDHLALTSHLTASLYLTSEMVSLFFLLSYAHHSASESYPLGR